MSERKQKVLQALYLSHNLELRQFLARRVGEQDAADLLQETWLHFLKITDINAVHKPRSFLYKIATNIAIDFGRKSKRHANFPIEDQDCDELPSPLPTPETVIEYDWQFERFTDVLKEMPATRQRAFIMNKMEGLTHAEIALSLGISEKSVQRTINKALNHLFNRLDSDNHD